MVYTCSILGTADVVIILIHPIVHKARIKNTTNFIQSASKFNSKLEIMYMTMHIFPIVSYYQEITL